MKIKIKADLNSSYRNMKNRFRQGISGRSAIVFSLLLHFMVAVAAATFWTNAVYVKPSASEATIEFDLTSDQSIPKSRNENLAKASAQKNTRSSKAGGESAIGNRSQNAVVMASLADLSQLKTSFNFVQQSVVAADSSGGFTPMQGGGIGIEINFLVEEYKNGRGKGGVTLSVGGACVSGSSN